MSAEKSDIFIIVSFQLLRGFPMLVNAFVGCIQRAESKILYLFTTLFHSLSK